MTEVRLDFLNQTEDERPPSRLGYVLAILLALSCSTLLVKGWLLYSLHNERTAASEELRQLEGKKALLGKKVADERVSLLSGQRRLAFARGGARAARAIAAICGSSALFFDELRVEAGRLMLSGRVANEEDIALFCGTLSSLGFYLEERRLGSLGKGKALEFTIICADREKSGERQP